MKYAPPQKMGHEMQGTLMNMLDEMRPYSENDPSVLGPFSYVPSRETYPPQYALCSPWTDKPQAILEVSFALCVATRLIGNLPVMGNFSIISTQEEVTYDPVTALRLRGHDCRFAGPIPSIIRAVVASYPQPSAHGGEVQVGVRDERGALLPERRAPADALPVTSLSLEVQAALIPLRRRKKL